MSVRTRRQKAVAMGTVDEKLATTGNGVAHGSPIPEKIEAGPKENIFLFWPNIVG